MVRRQRVFAELLLKLIDSAGSGGVRFEREIGTPDDPKLDENERPIVEENEGLGGPSHRNPERVARVDLVEDQYAGQDDQLVGDDFHRTSQSTREMTRVTY